jgi:hypothetical protein
VATPGARPDTAEVLQRRTTAVHLRRAGLTYSEIADRLGYSHASGARMAVMALLRENAVEETDEMRLIENARLDAWTAALTPACTKGDPRAIDTAVRVAARRARLNGLDRPLAIAVTPAVRSDAVEALERLRTTILGQPPTYDPDHLPG